MTNRELRIDLDELIIEDTYLMELNTPEKLDDLYELIKMGNLALNEHYPDVGHLVYVRVGE